MVDHAWVQENIDTYLAGELTTSERNRVERHAAACEACQQALAEANRIELAMSGLFADARPSPSLDDRVIQAVRTQPVRTVQRPRGWRVFAAAAAVLVIGMIGWVAQSLSTDGLPFGGDDAAKKVPPTYFGQAQVEHSSTPANVSALVKELEQQIETKEALKELTAGYTQGKLEGLVDGLNAEAKAKAKEEAYKTTKPSALQVEVQEQRAQWDKSPEMGEKTRVKVKLDEVHKELEAGYDSRAYFFRVPPGMPPQVGGGGGGKSGDGKDLKEYPAPDVTSVLRDNKVKDEIAMLSKLLDKSDKINDALKTFKDAPLDPSAEDPKRMTRPGEKEKGPVESKQPPPGKVPVGDSMPALVPPSLPTTTTPAGSLNLPGGFNPVPTAPPPMPVTPYFPGITPSVPPGPVASGKTPPPGDDKSDKKTDGGQKQPGRGKEDGQGKGEQGAKQGEAKGDEEGDKAKGGEKPASDKKPQGPKVEPKVPEPPAETSRKIIRTGEMEFEIESYYSAVDIITTILTGEIKDGKVVRPPVRGGFISTTNSDKLANGKMKGSIVVRMPPEYLDKFVLDLRRELTKNGELKNQRIVSLDVTKQYTDIESRLRAARTMEERLIQIIKIGKGEIKDLVAAERELGIWRTKIEEMEGEIRYYANQVSLSTLTIMLTEKDISAPTSLVLTENVRLRIEVDNVAEAHQAAMDAVEKIGGSITRSDLKLHPGGQLQSIIHADIPPTKKLEFVKVLGKLGIVSDTQESTQQRTEGGSGKPGGLKQRKGDVRFEVTMFNNANVRPRLSTDLKLATADVSGDYGRILDRVAKLGGQVRDAKLNEQDKMNINGYLDFNVPTDKKAEMDKLLFDIGGTPLERVNLRAPFSELSTERKFGYTVLLRDFASIPPSKGVVEIIASTDVPGSYAKLQEAIAKAKGLVVDAKVNEQDKYNIYAQVDFSIPTEEVGLFEKVLKDLGTSLQRTNIQAPLKTLSTARKFGYTISLRDFNSVPPTRSASELIAVVDVPAAYSKLIETVNKAKGYVSDARLNEQDKMNINAQIDFSIPTDETAAFDKMLKDLGASLQRINAQAPMKALATPRKFGYTVSLRDFNSVPASKSAGEVIAVIDVPTNYAKLVDAVKEAGGLIGDARLNEQDKLNINAQVDFSVMIDKKPAIDTLLDKLGIGLVRTTSQAPMNSLATNKKVGYVVVLRDLNSIPATKSTELKLATSDVPAAYAKLQDAIAKAEGHVASARLNEQDKLNITAVLAFSVPKDKKADFDKLLAEATTQLTRNNTELPVNQLSTPKKFGYVVELNDFASIRPSQFSEVKVAVSHVPSNYAKLLDAIAEAKGLVHDAKLNEQDKLNITGTIDFSVPSAKKESIEKLLAKLGSLLSRKDDQTAANILSTDKKFGYAVTLRDFANIPPREMFVVQVAIQDVGTSFREFKDAVGQARGWINLADDAPKTEAQINFDVPTEKRADIEKLLGKTGAITTRSSSQVPVDKLATDQKVGYQITLKSIASIPPREKTLIKFEVTNVDEESANLKEMVLANKGRVVDSTVDRHESGQVTAAVVFEVPFASQDLLLRQMKTSGRKLLSQRSTRDSKVPENELTTAHIIVTLTGVSPIVDSDKGLDTYVRTGLNLSFRILAIIFTAVLVGLSFIVPVVLLIWVGLKVFGFMFSSGHSRAVPILETATPADTKHAAEDDKPADSGQAPKA
jgi:hypothetical protein